MEFNRRGSVNAALPLFVAAASFVLLKPFGFMSFFAIREELQPAVLPGPLNNYRVLVC